MKKKIIMISIGVFILVIGIFIGTNINKVDSFDDNTSKTEVVKEKNLLSYYLENDDGEYVASTGESWPSKGYKFNATLSKCENGGELGWDDTNKVVTMTGNMSDKCYIYFDKVLTLASYVKSLYTGTQGENNIYYHNGTIKSDSEFTAGSTTYPAETVLDANDGSYRYAGASENVKNYVCFGSDEETCPTDNLYRIIGVFDNQIKLIKSTNATSALLGTDGAYKSDTSYYWSSLSQCPSSTTGYINNSSSNAIVLSNKKGILASPFTPVGCNTWRYSDLNITNLNINYIANIGYKWAGMIDETTWKVGGNTPAEIINVIPSLVYQNEVGSSSSSATINAQVGLMYVSDYYFAASPSAWTLVGSDSDATNAATPLNWLYLGIDEWTILPDVTYINLVFYALSGGGISSRYYISAVFSVRPTFYLNSDVTYVSGTGTSSDPIRIE